MDYIALGCMSGTSLDGIDLSLIRSDGDTYSEEIMNYFQPYSKDLKNKLHQVIQRGYLTDPKIAYSFIFRILADYPTISRLK